MPVDGVTLSDGKVKENAHTPADMGGREIEGRPAGDRPD
jgi:hypothetical protein